MQITAVNKTIPQTATDMLVCLVRQKKNNKPAGADRMVQTILDRAVKSGDFTGKEEQTLLAYPDRSVKGLDKIKRVLIVGLRKEDVSREGMRKCGGVIAATVIKTKAKKIAIVLPEKMGIATSDAGECLAEGLILGSYQFRKYKKNTTDNNDISRLTESVLLTRNAAVAQKGVNLGIAAAEAACRARDIAHEPANHWTPAHFATYAVKLAKKHGFTCTILGKKELEKLGMGGILAVNQGSALPPRMIILEYKAAQKAPTLLLVGKGLTFDSGGISLKPGSGMHDMKYDKCGGAAVLAAMQVVGLEKPKNVNVIAMVPATENMPGPGALKPGDVITQYGGKTVEVLNTDAEGRLILADALAYGVEQYKPDAVVDVATLTGAVIIGLGHHRTGLMANNEKLAECILKAGERCGEPLWRLPLGPEYTKQLKSEIADIKNVDTKRAAGTIIAGAFLQEFVGAASWAHLDIAGTAWNFTEKSYIPKGPSGIAVRTLAELIRAWK